MDHSKETSDWLLWVVSVIGIGNVYAIIKLVVLVPKQIKDLETKTGQLEKDYKMDHDTLIRIEASVNGIKENIDRITRE